jgi:A118 family predicted phage portal protein
LDYSWVDAKGTKRSRKRKSLNALKVAASELAGLALAEPPEVNVGPLVEKVIQTEKLWDNLKKTSEFQAALGGQVIKVCIEPRAAPENGHVSLDFVKAMNFVPTEWDNARVCGGIFVDRRVVGGKTLVHLEQHKSVEDYVEDGSSGPAASGYQITHRVFDEQTERELALAEFDDSLVPSVFIPIEEPLFFYFRNPEANNIDPESPLGISIGANALDTIEALDVAFDQFYSEVELGGRRIALPASTMRGFLDPETQTRRVGFDPTDRVFVRLETDDADKMKPTDLTFDLRIEQLRKAIQTGLDLFSVQVGFSAGYFSFDGTSVKTATEVISDNSKTFKTMKAFQGVLDDGLKHLFRVINLLGKAYSLEGAVDTEPSITWDDSVIESRDARAAYWQGLTQNKLTDRITALKAIHGLDDVKAAEMAAKIKEENTIVVDPTPGFGGGQGGAN